MLKVSQEVLLGVDDFIRVDEESAEAVEDEEPERQKQSKSCGGYFREIEICNTENYCGDR